MKLKQRTVIFIKSSRNAVIGLVRQILERYHVVTIYGAGNGKVEVKMRETAKRNFFYAGEVFMTECRVQINNSLGIGIVSGNDYELAFNLAVIDCAYNAGLEETAGWEELLLQEDDLTRNPEVTYSRQVLA